MALSAAVVNAAGIGCTSALDVHAMTAPNVQFDRYRTFAFDPSLGAPEKFATSSESPEVRGRIEKTAVSILEMRGYTHADSGGDLVLRIETGRRQSPRTEVPSVPSGDQTQIPFELAPLDDERPDLVEGSFVIDAFDAQTHRMVWHGAAREVIDPGHVSFERIQRAVEKVMASFPVRPAR